jgi:hypothetical protein
VRLTSTKSAWTNWSPRCHRASTCSAGARRPAGNLLDPVVQLWSVNGAHPQSAASYQQRCRGGLYLVLGTPRPTVVLGHVGVALAVPYAPVKVRWIQLPSEGIPVAVTTYSRYHPGGAMVAVAGI